MKKAMVISGNDSRFQTGATLIEVLVTMLIVAIGLLGAAGMQLTSTRYQQTAAMRSQAIIEAQFLLEKIRANSLATLTVAPPAPENSYLAADGYDDAAAVPADPGCGLAAQPVCTAAQASVKDIRDWKLSLQRLPGGRGSIFPVTGAGGAVDPAARLVFVMWQLMQLALHHKLAAYAAWQWWLPHE
jgi:type IV pilus assembly protein PilV